MTMGKAAWSDAKEKGELIQQRLRVLARAREVGDHYPHELATLTEAAETVEWYEKRCDSLIADHDKARDEIDRWRDMALERGEVCIKRGDEIEQKTRRVAELEGALQDLAQDAVLSLRYFGLPEKKFKVALPTKGSSEIISRSPLAAGGEPPDLTTTCADYPDAAEYFSNVTDTVPEKNSNTFEVGAYVSCYIAGNNTPREWGWIIGEANYSEGDVFVIATDKAIGMPVNRRHLSLEGATDPSKGGKLRTRYLDLYPGKLLPEKGGADV